MSHPIRPISFGESFGAAYRLYLDNFVALLAVSAVIQGIQFAAATALAPSVAGLFAGTEDAAALAWTSLTLVLSLVLGIAQTGIIIKLVSQAYLGRKLGFRVLAAKIARRLPALFLVFVALALVVVLPLVPAFLPLIAGAGPSPLTGILAAAGAVVSLVAYFALAFAPNCCVHEGTGAGASLKRSLFLTRGQKGKLFGFSFLFGILANAAARVASSLGLGPEGTLIAACALDALISPYLSCGIIAFYFGARAERESYALERLVEEFGEEGR